jgi:hypothetical protein
VYSTTAFEKDRCVRVDFNGADRGPRAAFDAVTMVICAAEVGKEEKAAGGVLKSACEDA